MLLLALKKLFHELLVVLLVFLLGSNHLAELDFEVIKPAFHSA
jgi:hypothetical protein